jgi:hypothetical protein
MVSDWPSLRHRGPTGALRFEGRGRQSRLSRIRPCPMTIDGQELPGAGYARQFDDAAVLEARARAGDQSRTALETRISPAAAWPRIRAAMCTAIPPMSEFSGSRSPMWMPKRISMPSVSASDQQMMSMVDNRLRRFVGRAERASGSEEL